MPLNRTGAYAPPLYRGHHFPATARPSPPPSLGPETQSASYMHQPLSSTLQPSSEPSSPIETKGSSQTSPSKENLHHPPSLPKRSN
ncbi:hypothetical protein SLA2020_512970 [Shorea laevis]